jgi:hypothetical protein
LAGDPWRLDEYLWETWSEAALAAHARGRRRAAARLWTSAAEAVERFPAGDPRRAASLNNHALAEDEPAAMLTAALGAWEAARSWIASMAPAPRGRSSTFHLRIETRNRTALAELARALLARDLDAGRAVTLANLALTRRPRDREAARLAAEARDLRRAAWGPNEAGTLWLDALLAALEARAEPPAPPNLPWSARRPVDFGDERRLKAAVFLSAFAP